MGQPTFDILWKPPPALVEEKEDYRWFYRICELLNGGLPGATTMLSVPAAENKTGATIKKGQLCGYAGVSNGTMDLQLYIANGTQSAYSVLGVASADIPDNQLGYLVYYGTVDGIDTSAWPIGTVLFASETTPGAITANIPVPPNLRIVVGSVLTQSTNGSIFVRIYPQLRADYGSWGNANSMTPVAANTAYPILFPLLGSAKGLTYNNATGTFTVATGGQYQITSTLQIKSTSNSPRQLAAWLVINNIDVIGSAQQVSLADNNTQMILALLFTPILAKGDTFKLMYASSAAGTPFIAAGVALAPAPNLRSASILINQVNI